MDPENEVLYVYHQEPNESLQNLIWERARFENEIYDYLVGPLISFIDNESFWEPVKVGYKNVKELPDDVTQDTCVICTEQHLNFKSLICCNQKMCNGCCYQWFESSVKCPYCFQDIREFHLKKKVH